MEHGFFHKLSSILWKAIVGVIVAFAIYVSFGRFIMSTVGTYGDDILRELNTRTPFMLQASQVSGEWHGMSALVMIFCRSDGSHAVLEWVARDRSDVTLLQTSSDSTSLTTATPQPFFVRSPWFGSQWDVFPPQHNPSACSVRGRVLRAVPGAAVAALFPGPMASCPSSPLLDEGDLFLSDPRS